MAVGMQTDVIGTSQATQGIHLALLLTHLDDTLINEAVYHHDVSAWMGEGRAREIGNREPCPACTIPPRDAMDARKVAYLIIGNHCLVAVHLESLSRAACYTTPCYIMRSSLPKMYRRIGLPLGAIPTIRWASRQPANETRRAVS